MKKLKNGLKNWRSRQKIQTIRQQLFQEVTSSESYLQRLACNLDVLILNGPTVGVDIGSKHDIHMVLQRLANQGLGVIIISDDLPEVIQNCSRVLVIKNGKIKSEYDTQNVSEQMIIDDMM